MLLNIPLSNCPNTGFLSVFLVVMAVVYGSYGSACLFSYLIVPVVLNRGIFPFERNLPHAFFTPVRILPLACGVCYRYIPRTGELSESLSATLRYCSTTPG